MARKLNGGPGLKGLGGQSCESAVRWIRASSAPGPILPWADIAQTDDVTNRYADSKSPILLVWHFVAGELSEVPPSVLGVRKDDALIEKDVIEFCRGRLAGFKQPRGVAFVAEIPRNPSGKILKRVLRDRFPGPAAV